MSDNPIKAIFFDLDGVLVDTLHYHYLAWQKMFQDIGGSVKEHTVLLHEGRNSREILPILLKETEIELAPEKHDLFIEGKRSYYRQIVHVEFYPGALKIVDQLKKSGFKVAIVTACAEETMRKSLEEKKQALFDLIQTGDDVPRAKPNPDPYDLARKKLGLKKEECVVVENAPLGIESAKKAGMVCITVETTLDRRYLQRADYVISNIQELITLPIFN